MVKLLEKDKKLLESMISGAIKDCIHAHGPITKPLIGSATKRIIGAIKGFSKIIERKNEKK